MQKAFHLHYFARELSSPNQSRSQSVRNTTTREDIINFIRVWLQKYLLIRYLKLLDLTSLNLLKYTLNKLIHSTFANVPHSHSFVTSKNIIFDILTAWHLARFDFHFLITNRRANQASVTRRPLWKFSLRELFSRFRTRQQNDNTSERMRAIMLSRAF